MRDLILKKHIHPTFLGHRGKMKGKCGHGGGDGRRYTAHEQRAVSRMERKTEDDRLYNTSVLPQIM